MAGKEAKAGGRGWSMAVLSAIVVLVAVVGWQQWTMRAEAEMQAGRHHLNLDGRGVLEMRLREEDIDDFAKVVAKRGVPIVVRRENNAVVSSWPALEVWPEGGLADALHQKGRKEENRVDISMLSEEARREKRRRECGDGACGVTLRNCKNGSRPLFTLVNPDKPMKASRELFGSSGMHAGGDEDRPSYHLEAIPSDIFFDAIESSDSSEDGNRDYLYYSGKLSWWGAEILSHVSPRALELSLVRYITEDGFESEESLSEVMVWTGSAGVIANAHYDRSHNFFVQVMGRKRWRLFSPQQWDCLYLYPAVHESYHQSQIGSLDVSSPLCHSSPNLHPRYYRNQAVEVILEPGDMLYVPPYWMHEVESLDAAISVSVLSPSQEEAIAAEASFMALLPFSEDGLLTRVELASVRYLTAVYIEMILDVLYADHLPHTKGSFASEQLTSTQRVGALLLQSRYRNVQVPSGTPDHCDALTSSAKDLPSSMPGILREDEQLFERLFQHATEVAKVYFSLADGVREVSLSDTLEEMATFAVAVEHLKPFFQLCFR